MTTKNPTHQINETHLGTDATPTEAQRLAEILTVMGYPSEYNSTQGVSSRLRDPETDELTEIPAEVFEAAMQTLLAQ